MLQYYRAINGLQAAPKRPTRASLVAWMPRLSCETGRRLSIHIFPLFCRKNIGFSCKNFGFSCVYLPGEKMDNMPIWPAMPTTSRLQLLLLLLTTDYWLLTTDYWLLTSDYWLLTTDYWLLATGYWLLATGYWLLATDYWLLTTDYWLLATTDYYWLLATTDYYWLLLTTTD